MYAYKLYVYMHEVLWECAYAPKKLRIPRKPAL